MSLVVGQPRGSFFSRIWDFFTGPTKSARPADSSHVVGSGPTTPRGETHNIVEKSAALPTSAASVGVRVTDVEKLGALASLSDSGSSTQNGSKSIVKSVETESNARKLDAFRKKYARPYAALTKCPTTDQFKLQLKEGPPLTVKIASYSEEGEYTDPITFESFVVEPDDIGRLQLKEEAGELLGVVEGNVVFLFRASTFEEALKTSKYNPFTNNPIEQLVRIGSPPFSWRVG